MAIPANRGAESAPSCVMGRKTSGAVCLVFAYTFNCFGQLRCNAGFQQIAARSEPECFVYICSIAMLAHKDDRDFRGEFFQVASSFEASHDRHGYVQENQIEIDTANHL